MGIDRRLQDIQRSLALDPSHPVLRRRYDAILLRIYGADCLEVLRDARDWQRADATTRDAALALILHRLGAAWSLLEETEIDGPLGRTRIVAYRHNATGARFHLIPGGRYEIGSLLIFEASPPREVTVAPLLVGQLPVLQREWDAVGGEDSRKWRDPALPIEGVAWKSLRPWLQRAGGGLRLPSEAEWEYACRAGSRSRFYWGESMDPSACWYKQNAKGRTHPPEAHLEKANGFGLVDTLGNVYEACEDRYYPDYHGNFPEDGRPRGDRKGTYRVRRGGSWCGEPDKCQSAYRAPYPRWKAVSTLGFRLVCSIPGLD